jgi:hypothetical protein
MALMDGTVAAFDDTALDQLWKINLSAGFAAPPVTFEASCDAPPPCFMCSGCKRGARGAPCCGADRPADDIG